VTLSTRKDEFAELLSRHRGRIFSYILALVQNTADAEDVLQQVSLVLWRKFDEYDRQGSFSGWACKTAQFIVLNFMRGRRRSRVFFNEDLVTELAEVRSAIYEREDDDFQVALQSCLEKLSRRDRTLLDRCYGETFSIKQAAERIGRPVGSVYQSLGRIRRALLRCITHRLAVEEGC
jgi:RNA polymerase sigma-70 factor (ECF subfamily)